MFWEGKLEYAMQFFIPLIYYATEGHLILTDKVAGITARIREKRNLIRKIYEV